MILDADMTVRPEDLPRFYADRSSSADFCEWNAFNLSNGRTRDAFRQFSRQ